MSATVIALKYALLVGRWSGGHFLKLTNSALFEWHDKSSPWSYRDHRLCAVTSLHSMHIIYLLFISQEALLPQRDRATRFVSRNLVNCCGTAENQFYNESRTDQRVELNGKSKSKIKLKGYSRLTCNKLCGMSGHDVSSVECVVHELDRRRVLLITSSPWRREIFSVQTKAQREVPLLLDIAELFYNTT